MPPGSGYPVGDLVGKLVGKLVGDRDGNRVGRLVGALDGKGVAVTVVNMTVMKIARRSWHSFTGRPISAIVAIADDTTSFYPPLLLVKMAASGRVARASQMPLSDDDDGNFRHTLAASRLEPEI